MKIFSCRPSYQTKSCIDLWIAPTVTNPDVASINHFEIMSNEEKQKYRSLRLESSRRRFLVSRVLLRTALSHTAKEKVDPRYWRYETNRYGKPFIATSVGLPRLNFSLSHSKDIAVVAICSTFDVGVDIESLDQTMITDPTDICLSRGEHDWLESRTPSTRWHDFMKLWTVKEAYAKLVGQGIHLDFSTFEIAMDPLHMVRTENGVRQPTNLHLVTQEIHLLDSLYQLSLATECLPTEKPIVMFRVFDSQLIESREYKVIA